MTAQTSLPDHLIKPRAFELTPIVLAEKGIDQSEPIHFITQNTLFELEQSKRHGLAVGWPDNTFCVFKSDTPIQFDDVFHTQFKAAYRKSRNLGQHTYELG